MRILTLTLFVFFAFKALAQQPAPAMDSSWLPQVGDKYYIYALQGESSIDFPLVSANDTGSNITWHFDSVFYVSSYKPADSFDFTVPSARNIPCQNPSANFARGNDTLYSCYIKNANGIYLADNKINTQLFIPSNPYPHLPNIIIDYYNIPETFIKGSFKFKEQYDETSSHYYYKQKHSQADSNSHQKRIRSLIFDGFGTLNVAGKSFDSVVRIKETTFQIDSVWFGGAYSKTYDLQSIYYWYKHNIHAPLMYVYRDWESDLKKDTVSFIGGVEYLTSPVGESPSGIPHSPAFQNTTANMADGYIDVHNAGDYGIQYNIYDADGRMITSGSKTTNADTWQIPVNNLSNGVYILKLQNNKGENTVIKLVKDH